MDCGGGQHSEKLDASSFRDMIFAGESRFPLSKPAERFLIRGSGFGMARKNNFFRNLQGRASHRDTNRFMRAGTPVEETCQC